MATDVKTELIDVLRSDRSSSGGFVESQHPRDKNGRFSTKEGRGKGALSGSLNDAFAVPTSEKYQRSKKKHRNSPAAAMFFLGAVAVFGLLSLTSISIQMEAEKERRQQESESAQARQQYREQEWQRQQERAQENAARQKKYEEAAKARREKYEEERRAHKEKWDKEYKEWQDTYEQAKQAYKRATGRDYEESYRYRGASGGNSSSSGSSRSYSSPQEKEWRQTIGVDENASYEDIKKAWRKMAKKYHPDVNKDPGAEEMMKKINRAFDELEKRNRRDSLFTLVGQLRSDRGRFTESEHPRDRSGRFSKKGSHGNNNRSKFSSGRTSSEPEGSNEDFSRNNPSIDPPTNSKNYNHSKTKFKDNKGAADFFRRLAGFGVVLSLYAVADHLETQAYKAARKKWEEEFDYWQQARNASEEAAGSTGSNVGNEQAEKEQETKWRDVLGVGPNDDFATIKKAWRQKAKKYHPDVNRDPGAEEMIKTINNAFDELEKRIRKDSLKVLLNQLRKDRSAFKEENVARDENGRFATKSGSRVGKRASRQNKVSSGNTGENLNKSNGFSEEHREAFKRVVELADKNKGVAGATVLALGAAAAGGVVAYDLMQSQTDFDSIRMPPNGMPDEETLKKYDEFKPGDLIRKNFRGPIWGSRQHYGIYMGKDSQGRHLMVNVSRSKKGGAEMRVDFLVPEEPNPDSTEYERVRVDESFAPEKIIKRAKHVIGKEFSYLGFNSNCESVARGIVEGNAYSTQGNRVSPFTRNLIAFVGGALGTVTGRSGITDKDMIKLFERYSGQHEKRDSEGGLTAAEYINLRCDRGRFSEELHPRDKRGRFISKKGGGANKGSSNKATKVRNTNNENEVGKNNKTTDPGQEKSRENIGKAAAWATGAAAVGVAAFLGVPLIDQQFQVSGNIARQLYVEMNNVDADALIDQAPFSAEMKKQGKDLVGLSKKNIAKYLLKKEEAEIVDIDPKTNSVTYKRKNGNLMTVGSVGSKIFTFGSTRGASFGGHPSYEIGFKIDEAYNRKEMSRKEASEIIKMTKAAFEKHLKALPDNAFLKARPHQDDGAGAKRKNIYTKRGFRELPLRGDYLWALKDRGKFVSIPDEQVEHIASVIKGERKEDSLFVEVGEIDGAKVFEVSTSFSIRTDSAIAAVEFKSALKLLPEGCLIRRRKPIERGDSIFKSLSKDGDYAWAIGYSTDIVAIPGSMLNQYRLMLAGSDRQDGPVGKWNPDQHPRDKNGRFSSKKGGVALNAAGTKLHRNPSGLDKFEGQAGSVPEVREGKSGEYIKAGESLIGDQLENPKFKEAAARMHKARDEFCEVRLHIQEIYDNGGEASQEDWEKYSKAQSNFSQELERFVPIAEKQMTGARQELIDKSPISRKEAEARTAEREVVGKVSFFPGGNDEADALAKESFTEFQQLTGHETGVKSLVINNTGRSFFNPETDEIQISNFNKSKGEIFHEMAHELEIRTPGMAEAAKDWQYKRADVKEKTSLSLINPVYHPSEMAYRDQFIHEYVGKNYEDEQGKTFATEVVSMGMQYMDNPRSMAIFYALDEEHFHFTLGAIAKARANKKKAGKRTDAENIRSVLISRLQRHDYDPHQPRDEDGRFASKGASGFLPASARNGTPVRGKRRPQPQHEQIARKVATVAGSMAVAGLIAGGTVLAAQGLASAVSTASGGASSKQSRSAGTNTSQTPDLDDLLNNKEQETQQNEPKRIGSGQEDVDPKLREALRHLRKRNSKNVEVPTDVEIPGKDAPQEERVRALAKYLQKRNGEPIPGAGESNFFERLKGNQTKKPKKGSKKNGQPRGDDDEWQESEHQRDRSGRFASKKSSGSGKKQGENRPGISKVVQWVSQNRENLAAKGGGAVGGVVGGAVGGPVGAAIGQIGGQMAVRHGLAIGKAAMSAQDKLQRDERFQAANDFEKAIKFTQAAFAEMSENQFEELESNVSKDNMGWLIAHAAEFGIGLIPGGNAVPLAGAAASAVITPRLHQIKQGIKNGTIKPQSAQSQGPALA